MGLRELELIDIETEEKAVRKARKRKGSRTEEKQRAVKGWPVDKRVSEGHSLRAKGKWKKDSNEEEWEEEWEEGSDEEEWEEEWEEDSDEEEWGEGSDEEEWEEGFDEEGWEEEPDEEEWEEDSDEEEWEEDSDEEEWEEEPGEEEWEEDSDEEEWGEGFDDEEEWQEGSDERGREEGLYRKDYGEGEWKARKRPGVRQPLKGYQSKKNRVRKYAAVRERMEKSPLEKNQQGNHLAKRRKEEGYRARGSRMEEGRGARNRDKERPMPERAKKESPMPRSADIQEIKRRKKRRRRRVRAIRGMITAFTLTLAVGLFLGVAWLAVRVYKEMKEKEVVQTAVTTEVQEIESQDIREWAKFYALDLERPALAVDLLTVNEYSRPGEELPEVKSIFIHYTANAGTTAEQNRSYFESLSESHERSASAHFVIGYDGVIVQCIPTKEIAYAVKGRNYDSISIECCYLDENGKFEEETYETLIELTAWLLHKYELRPENVLRHYDEGGKNCPKYYVEHEDAWDRFLMDLEKYMAGLVEEEENGL